MKTFILCGWIALGLAIFAHAGSACTSAVISGKATPDGRPILWKNRDTSNDQNCVKYFTGERFSYVGVVNSDSESPKSVWIGVNSVGFAVMNTLSYNLKEKAAGESGGARNGSVMLRALAICETVEDFRIFLDTMSQPRFVEANYGVIDAKGGAAMFEVSDSTNVMFDANDPATAPFGYVVRTNFSYTGKAEAGSGHVRYEQADRFFFTASASRSITPEWIFKNVARSFTNPILGIDLKEGALNWPNTTGWFVEQDFIARKKSTCSVAIQGVKAGELPELTTMWTVIGYPPVTPAVPIWVKGAGKQLPVQLVRDSNLKASPLCNAALKLRNQVYSFARGTDSDRYFYWELLHNTSGTGYMQKLEPLEQDIFRESQARLNTWRKQGSLNTTEVYALYNALDKRISDFFQNNY